MHKIGATMIPVMLCRLRIDIYMVSGPILHVGLLLFIKLNDLDHFSSIKRIILYEIKMSFHGFLFSIFVLFNICQSCLSMIIFLKLLYTIVFKIIDIRFSNIY
jgi:hypothetical protein